MGTTHYVRNTLTCSMASALSRPLLPIASPYISNRRHGGMVMVVYIYGCGYGWPPVERGAALGAWRQKRAPLNIEFKF
eukprot:scaffold180571_cov37-Tisochrysis_lutea.AAC.3